LIKYSKQYKSKKSEWNYSPHPNLQVNKRVLERFRKEFAEKNKKECYKR